MFRNLLSRLAPSATQTRVVALVALGVLLPAATLPAAPAESEEPSSSEPALEAEPEQPLVVEEVLEVVGDWQPISAIEIRSREDLPPMPAGDGADLLRGFAGVALGRMGGHGLEPWIRGLGESNLNVLMDGAYIHGGCPNRMDPPTSFAATSGFDRVTVIKGVQSLRYGAGGNAGTVLYERLAPVPDDEVPWRIEAQSGLGGWTSRPGIALDASWAAERFYLRAEAESRDLDSYEDGAGATVRSAYASRLANVMVGIGDRERGFLELGFEQSRTDDALFAGAGMDSPEDRSDTLRLKFRRGRGAGRWTAFETDLYLSRVDHLMDNYSLRPLAAAMAMRVPTSSDTVGGRTSARLELGTGTLLTLGLDYQRNERLALRFAGPSPEAVDRLQSVMWPDADLSQGGLFVEGDRVFGRGSRVRFGLRLDSFEASAATAGRQPVGTNLSPNALYRAYYGRAADNWSDRGISALLRYERRLDAAWTVFAGASRSLRAADATERYLASSSPVTANRWVGNPRLDVSVHRQVDAGLARTTEGHRWSATAFVDSVQDFILRDRARGQEGVTASDNASIYRNVEARLLGIELEAGWSPVSALGVRAQASWVRGDNRSDDRPLAQIPALQGNVAADYAAGPWRGTAAVRWALEQDRVDDDPLTGGGLDIGPTAGYGVLDIDTAYRWPSGIEVGAGVDNVLDKAFAQHLNRGNLFDPDPVRVNEPGRSIWLRLRWLGGANVSLSP